METSHPLTNAVSKIIQFTFCRQPLVARRMRNKDVSHLNAFCHSYLRHIHHRGSTYDKLAG